MQIGGMRYGGNTKLLVTSHMRVETTGMYGLQVIQSGITRDKWQMSIGENIMYFRWVNSTTGYIDLFFPDPGKEQGASGRGGVSPLPAHKNTTFASHRRTSFDCGIHLSATGFYNITIWMYPDYATNLDFKWQSPTDPSYLNRNWFWILNFDSPPAPVNDPNVADK
mgnify:CR=1 FL=1